MNWFQSIYSDDLPSRAVSVYMYLVHRANAGGHCWPSAQKMSSDLGMSKSTVKRAIADLVSHGYVTTEKRYRENGANSSLMYTVRDFQKYRTTKG